MSTEQVKMKSGKSYTCKEKTIILNVFLYFRKIFPEDSITYTVIRTSEATGCSEKSIYKFRKEANSPEGFKEPCKRKKRPLPYTNSRSIKYDESVRESIRNIVRNNEPTMSNILKCVNSDEKLPVFKQSTLRRLLFDMGFTFDKSNKKNILVETGGKKVQKKKAKPSKRVPKEEALINFVKCESIELENTVKTPNNYEYVTQTVIQPVLVNPLSHNSQTVVVQPVPNSNSLYGQELVNYMPMAALDYQRKMLENHSTLDSSIRYTTSSFNHMDHCKIEQ